MEKIGDYQFIRTRDSELGRGSFSIVYLGIYNGVENVYMAHNQKIAIKVIKTNNLTTKAKEILEDEITIMKLIKDDPHPNIVECYDVIIQKDELFIIMEYCDSGDLRKILKKPIKERFAQFYFCQLANGLKYLSRHCIIHRDIKPRNILLTDGRKILKIADFGFATKFNNKSLHDTICGSPLYMAPEIMNNNKYDNQADLWSIGMILYEMLYGAHPFNSCRTFPELKDTIANTIIEIPPSNTKNKDISENCIHLLRWLLQKKANDRITWDSFFEDPWIKAYQCIPPRQDEYEKKLQATSIGSLANEEILAPQSPPKNEPIIPTSTTPGDKEHVNINIIDNYCDQIDKYTALQTEKTKDDIEVIGVNQRFPQDCIFEMDIDDVDKDKNKKVRIKQIIEKSSVLNEDDKTYDIIDSV
jgi:serine/threonine protein kinase